VPALADGFNLLLVTEHLDEVGQVEGAAERQSHIPGPAQQRQ
jgi:hypothetical protein